MCKLLLKARPWSHFSPLIGWQAIKAETDGLREELEIVRTLGADLIFACGETEKPEVKKTIDEVRTLSYVHAYQHPLHTHTLSFAHSNYQFKAIKITARTL